MAKISINQSPTFAVDVEIPRVGGKSVKVPFTFKFMSREQLADFTDAGIAGAKEVKALIEAEPTARDLVSRVTTNQVSQLQTIIHAWGFEEELNEDNIRALVNSSATVPEAILTAYNQAYQAAREGN